VAVSKRKDLILAYLAQKDYYYIRCSPVEISRIPMDEIRIVYSDMELYWHHGFALTPYDSYAISSQMEEDKLIYSNAIDDLKEILYHLPDEKDKKKIEKAIKVIKDNKELFKGAKHKMRIMHDVLLLDMENIVQEMAMMGMYDCINEG
jgi:hypothetical protein